MMSGQIAGLVKDIKPCKAILESIVKQAQERLQDIRLELGE